MLPIVLLLALTLPLDNFKVGHKFEEKSSEGVPHKGIDLDAPAGTPIKCVESGVIIFVGCYFPILDKTFYTGVDVSCGDRVWSYHHIKPAEGVDFVKRINAGDVIGHIVKDPYGPDHLHLEVRKYVDPVELLPELNR